MDEKQIEELKQRVKSEEANSHIHRPYAETSGREADFEVEYEIDVHPDLDKIKPSQGMRCDFLYEGDDPGVDGIHMIWPELLDEKGDVIREKNKGIQKKGRATMWIGSEETRELHRQRIHVGVKGYWVVGSKKIAVVKVTKVLGL